MRIIRPLPAHTSALPIALLLALTALSACVPIPEKPAPPVPAEALDGTQPDEDDPAPAKGTFTGDPLVVDDGESPPIGLVAPSPSKEFRAASWNIRNWYPGKNGRAASVSPSATTMIDTLFATFEEFDLDVIALQELYVTSGAPSLPVPTAHAAKYEVIYGPVAISNGAVRGEYCPIVFDKTEITCKPQSSTVWQFNNRGVHWAVCHPKDHADKEFFFGCGHLDPNPTRAKSNISNFFLRLTHSPGAGPNFKFNGSGQLIERSEFIVGMDANSEYHAGNGLGKRWRNEHTRFEPDMNKPLIEFERVSGPFGGNPGSRTFTKLHGKRTGNILRLRLNRDRRMWVLDDLFWSVSKVQYLTDSKQVVPVQLLSGVQNMTPAQRETFWEAYYEFSDHLPVKADFRFAE